MSELTKYAILLKPSLNRVYFETSKEIGIAELSVLGFNLSSNPKSVKIEDIAGAPYITFQSPELSQEEVSIISDHSSLYTLYEVTGELLKPVLLSKRDVFDDDLITIQKYTGKTNEYFTKLLLNVCIASSKFWGEQQLNILDPMCGRGTTMLQALTFGHNSAGIELSKSLYSSFEAFIKSYMKTKRIKHRFQNQKKKNQFILETAATKEDFKTNKFIKLSISNNDTTETRNLFPKNDFHCVVADLPYGVQHGSSSESALSRSPLALIKSAASGWIDVLKPGGCLGLAWNVNTCSRQALAGALTKFGVEVLDADEYLKFEHRVDQAVVRDIIIARK